MLDKPPRLAVLGTSCSLPAMTPAPRVSVSASDYLARVTGSAAAPGRCAGSVMLVAQDSGWANLWRQTGDA